jgi:hypothetical protein
MTKTIKCKDFMQALKTPPRRKGKSIFYKIIRCPVLSFMKTNKREQQQCVDIQKNEKTLYFQNLITSTSQMEI